MWQKKRLEGRMRQTLSEVFNNYYINVVNELLNKEPDNKQKFSSMNILDTMFVIPTDSLEMEKIIDSLKSSNSSGLDGISNNLLKISKPFITHPLVHIVNLSFSTGYFPKCLKLSKIIPVFKKGDKKEVSNYRPITLLSSLSKVFEKAFLNRLITFAKKHNILSEKQFGFQKLKSTKSAISTTLNNIIDKLNNKENVIGLFLDLSKAFDCVHHETLINKLNKMGIRGLSGDWLLSYLIDREQCTEIRQSNKYGWKTCYQSSFQKVKYGVPQGSVLGPYLFLLYINDLSDLVSKKGMGITLYADDTTILVSNNTLEELKLSINGLCIELRNYFTAHNLVPNISKTSYILFNLCKANTAMVNTLNVTYDNQCIQETQKANFLGIAIDNKLSWHAHIESVCTKLNKVIFLMVQLKRVVSQKQLLMVDHSLFHSILDYGAMLWGTASKTDIQHILILQKRAIRIIANLKPRESCRKAFVSLNILTVVNVYLYYIITYVKNLEISKNEDVHDHDTRHKCNFFIESYRGVFAEKNITYAGSMYYNILPTELKSCTNYNIFKKKLKSTLASNCIYSIEEFKQLCQENI